MILMLLTYTFLPLWRLSTPHCHWAYATHRKNVCDSLRLTTALMI